MLTDLEDRLSVIKRWQIVRTIQKQSVAEHSFRVALIADRVARWLFDVVDEKELYKIQQLALFHDLPEAVTGDNPTPSKQWVDEDALMGSVANELDGAMYPGALVLLDTERLHYVRDKAIVKIADIIEASMFLYTEEAMGNAYVSTIQTFLTKRLDEALANSGLSRAQLGEAVKDLQLVSSKFVSHLPNIT